MGAVAEFGLDHRARQFSALTVAACASRLLATRGGNLTRTVVSVLRGRFPHHILPALFSPCAELVQRREGAGFTHQKSAGSISRRKAARDLTFTGSLRAASYPT